MPHPDDGLLEEYLDGELAAPAAAELERHLDGCAECRTRLAVAQRTATEAMALVTDLGEPAVVPVPAATPRRVPSRNWKPLAWAATVLVAAGLGYAGGSWRPQQAHVVMPQEPRPAMEEQAPPPAIATVPDQAAPGEADARSSEARTPASGRDALAPVPTAPSRDAVAPTHERQELARRAEAEQAASDELADQAVAAAQPATEPVAKARLDAAAEYRAPMLQGNRLGAAAAGRAGGEMAYPEAVALLGGSIRLIEGLTPEAVEVVPGGVGPEGAPAVRIRYPGGIELVEWRVDRRQGQPVVIESSMARWETADGFALRLTAELSPDELRALANRVR